METASEFVNAQRPSLLHFLDGDVRNRSVAPRALRYVQKVLDAWTRWATDRVLAPPTDEERTFWYALYQVEELAENAEHGPPCEYELLMIRQLAQIRELLRRGECLPDGFFATRPGEWDDLPEDCFEDDF